MFLRYIRNTFWFCIMSCVIAWCMCHMCFLGFYVNPAQQNNQGMLIGIVAALTVALWILSYNKKTRLAGILIIAAVAAVFLIVIYASGNMTLAVRDTEENPYLYFAICFVVIIGVWLLAATKRGLIVLLVIGVFISALVAFLYQTNSVVWLTGFLAGCIILYALRHYYSSILDSQTVKTSFASSFAVTVVCAVILIAAGSAVYTGVVRPIDPPAHELKLYDKEKAMTFVNKLGVSHTVTVLDPSLTTDELDEDSPQEMQDDPKLDGASNGNESREQEEQNGIDRWEELVNNDVNVIGYNLPVEKTWLIPLVILIIAAGAIILKLLTRKWWFAGICQKSRNEQVLDLYHFWLKKYRQIKLGKHPEETPYEYASREREHLASFAIPQADMGRLTEIFVEAGYGNREVTEEECRLYHEFHRKLYKMLWKYLGPFRYVVKFFVL